MSNDCTALPKKQPELVQLLDALGRHDVELNNIYETLSGFNDRLLGSVPEGIEKQPEFVTPPGVFGEIQQRTRNIEGIVRAIHTQISRLEEIG